MLNQNDKMPPVTDFEDIIPNETMVTTSEKMESTTFDKRNYLDFSIPEGKKMREITIRLLPVVIDDNKPHQYFQIVHLHNIPVHKDLNPNKSGKKAYMCLNVKNIGIDHEKYGTKCPICEAQQDLWKMWHDETDNAKKKEILKSINQLEIREYCILRCIERGKEDEGPKFWRIPLRQDKTDAYHKITLLAKQRNEESKEAGGNLNIFCPYNGRDLTITFTEGNGAPTIIDKGVSTPVTKDEKLLCDWYYDPKKWSDVFSTKPYEYLKIAYDGNIPWFDKANNKWVTKDEIENTKKNGEEQINNTIEEVEKQFITPSVSANENMPSEVINTNEVVSHYEFTTGSSVCDMDDLPF